MAFRLFGIGSKKNSGASSQPQQAPAVEEAAEAADPANDFMIVEPVQPSAAAAAAAATPPSYPAPRDPPRRQKSQTPTNYMDGVPFVISGGGSGAGGGANVSSNPEIKAILNRIDDYERRVAGIDWSALDYDFSKEKAVVSQEMTDTMKKVYLGP